MINFEIIYVQSPQNTYLKPSVELPYFWVIKTVIMEVTRHIFLEKINLFSRFVIRLAAGINQDIGIALL